VAVQAELGAALQGPCGGRRRTAASSVAARRSGWRAQWRHGRSMGRRARWRHGQSSGRRARWWHRRSSGRRLTADLAAREADGGGEIFGFNERGCGFLARLSGKMPRSFSSLLEAVSLMHSDMLELNLLLPSLVEVSLRSRAGPTFGICSRNLIVQ
jgi:hypothetical protein